MPSLDPTLPGVRVIERGWLNCNQVLLLADDGHVVIDTGYATGADETLRAVARELAGEPLARVINTHCHADHMGGNAALVRRYGCAVTVPAGDAGDVRAWSRQAFLLDYADHQAEPFDCDGTLAPGARFAAGGFEWCALPAPGHDAHALVYWCEAQRLLVSGDALWENGCGAIFPLPSLDAALADAHATLDRIAALAPRWVIPGHGRPFTDVAGAVARTRARLDAFGADPRRNARHVMKSVLAFALLARGGMRADAVAAYCARVPIYADLTERFLDEPLAVVVGQLVAELERAGMLRVRDGWLEPAIAA